MKLQRIYEFSDNYDNKIIKLISSGQSSNIKLALEMDKSINNSRVHSQYEEISTLLDKSVLDILLLDYEQFNDHISYLFQQLSKKQHTNIFKFPLLPKIQSIKFSNIYNFSIDLSALVNLIEVEFNECSINKLVIDNYMLMIFKAYDLRIDKPEFKNIKQLTNLTLKNAWIELKHFIRADKLKLLYISQYMLDNKIPKKIAGRLTKLTMTQLNISDFDASQFKNLSRLNIMTNNLRHIDVSSLKMLSEIDITDNTITTLDLSENTKISEVTAWRNPLKQVILPKGSNPTKLFNRNVKVITK